MTSNRAIIRPLKSAILILLFLSAFINTRTLKSRRAAKYFWDSPKNFENDIKVLEDPTTSIDYIQSFFLGLLSTVGIIGASKVSLAFGLILSNKLNYSFTQDKKKYDCNKAGFFDYVKHYSIESLSEAQLLKYNNCKEEKKKMASAIEEIDNAFMCAQDIKMNEYHNSCTGERYQIYKAFLVKNWMEEKEILHNFNVLTRLSINSHEKYDKIDCEDSAVDGILGIIIHKLKQGYYSLKFGLSCTKDLDFKVGMFVFTTILNVFATFLSGGVYTIAKLVVIVLKMFYSIFQLIKNYEWQTLRYQYIGEVIGYLIRIGLELIQCPILESPFLFEKTQATKRFRLHK